MNKVFPKTEAARSISKKQSKGMASQADTSEHSTNKASKEQKKELTKKRKAASQENAISKRAKSSVDQHTEGELSISDNDNATTHEEPHTSERAPEDMHHHADDVLAPPQSVCRAPAVGDARQEDTQIDQLKRLAKLAMHKLQEITESRAYILGTNVSLCLGFVFVSVQRCIAFVSFSFLLFIVTV